ncbi:hypothetical protein RSSM_06845 [Rhodopirellula sallentina SM41]|uniref:Uncharacterized protein n=1 Tax=Rhodopirellula sallentina SM41 TaxID=1263870 RepID=M5U6Z3_9BACT|nr:hypothetical protein RSSM_06845 [Rhodopirellula sallentina SM41]
MLRYWLVVISKFVRIEFDAWLTLMCKGCVFFRLYVLSIDSVV